MRDRVRHEGINVSEDARGNLEKIYPMNLAWVRIFRLQDRLLALTTN